MNELGDKALALFGKYSLPEQVEALKYIIEKLENRREENRKFTAQVIEFLSKETSVRLSK